jgi:quinol monooxygenase YgiN
MSFTVIAHYTARAGESEAVRAALRLMIQPTRAEPGCLRYEVYVDPNDADLVMLVESYLDAAAFQSHLDSPHFDRHLRNDVLPRLADRKRFDLVPLGEGAS